METRIIFLILLLSDFQCIAQNNFLSNESFEYLIKCPTSGFDFPVKGWYVLNGTPDVFSTCAPAESGFNIPNNYQGTRSTFSGFSYIGFFLLMDSFNKKDYLLEESVYTELNKKLIIGKRYKITFSISLSDSSSLDTDSIYCTLSDSPPIISANIRRLTGPHKYFKKFDIYSSNIDFPIKKKWNLVEMHFTAKSEYKFLSIGLPRNCYKKSTYDNDLFHSINKHSKLENSAYYYLDNVSLVEE